MVDVTVVKVLNAHSVFMKLIDEKVPYATARKIQRILTELEKEVKLFEAEKERVAEKVAHLESEEEKNAEFNVGIQEVLNSVIDLDVELLAPNALGEFKLTARDLVFIDFLIMEK